MWSVPCILGKKKIVNYFTSSFRGHNSKLLHTQMVQIPPQKLVRLTILKCFVSTAWPWRDDSSVGWLFGWYRRIQPASKCYLYTVVSLCCRPVVVGCGGRRARALLA